MSKKVRVLSLGGSIVIPGPVDYKFLEKFKKVLHRNFAHNKFVIVVGGGSIARAYINALMHETHDQKEVAKAGIRATRMNAEFLMQFFGTKDSNDILPRNMKQVKDALKKNKVVLCGALRYADNETSDSSAAKLARALKTEFINITNVPGLYTADPRTTKNATLIPYEDWKSFEKRVHKHTFKPGQHFVLDQSAATLIRKSKITTHIIGKDAANLEKLLTGKKFKGTTIGP